jgi:hypothetical protein
MTYQGQYHDYIVNSKRSHQDDTSVRPQSHKNDGREVKDGRHGYYPSCIALGGPGRVDRTRRDRSHLAGCGRCSDQ